MLSDLKIRKARHEDKLYKINDYGGLILIVSKKNKKCSGTKSFSFRYTKDKKTHQKTIGKYPAMSLSSARNLVESYRLKIDQGEDPFKKEIIVSNKSFKSIAADWLINVKRDVSYTHKETIIQRLNNYIYPFFGCLDMSEIKTQDALKLINSITRKGKIETARRIIGIIGEVFKYGVLCGACEYDITSPLKGYVKKQEVKHMPTLTEPKEIGQMLKAIWGYNGRATTCLALRLSAYTFCRPKEIRLAEWAEIDFKNKLWTIPKTKMKMKREHVVPLASQVIELFEEMRMYTSDRKYIFANPRRDKELGLSENTVNSALRKLDYTDIMVAHGFRGMASTILHEKAYSPLHIEMQLAHAEKNSVKAAYNHATYLEERVKMMQKYADYLDYLRHR